MAKYLTIAEQAHDQVNQIIKLVDDGGGNVDKALLTKHLGHLYNLGIRTAPRPVQGTVRLRAVQRAVQGLPVRVSMEKKDDGRGGSYNALSIETIV